MRYHLYDTGGWETSQDGGYGDDLVLCFPTWIQLYPESVGGRGNRINGLQFGSCHVFYRFRAVFDSKSGLAAGVCSACGAPDDRPFALYSPCGLFRDHPTCEEPEQTVDLPSGESLPDLLLFFLLPSCNVVLHFSLYTDFTLWVHSISDCPHFHVKVPRLGNAQEHTEVGRKAALECRSSRCQIMCSPWATNASLPFQALNLSYSSTGHYFKILESLSGDKSMVQGKKNSWPNIAQQVSS